MNRIVVFSSIQKLSHHIRTLMPQLEIVEIIPGNKSNNDLSKLETAEIIIADVSLIPKYINNLKSVKWIQATTAGVEKLFTPHEINEKNKYSNFIITRFINNDYGMDLAEYVIAHIVNHERNQWHEYNCQRNKIWADEIPDRRLIGDMTIGILGFGNLGQCVGKMLKNFGAKIWGLTRTQPSPEVLKILDEHRTTNNLPDLLKNCDYIINLMPATLETDGLLNGNILEHCRKKETVFMNIGRGNIIKELDLVNALEKKWISAAILDVFEVEPLPETSKLWHMPQVIVTPHNACTAKTKTIASLFQSNYDKFINNQSLPNIVDYQRGY